MNKNILIVFLLLIIVILGYFQFRPKNVNSDLVNLQNNNQTPSNTNSLKNYTTEFASFSYKDNASIQPTKGKGIFNVGKDINDPYLERIVFYSDTYHVSPIMSDNYIALQNETYGNNTFEVYRSTEGGTKIYVLSSDTKAISVAIPFRTGGNDTPLYTDLSSLSFNS